MKHFFLAKLRLSYYFVTLIIFFSIISYLIKGIELERAALTLFSVNSFLYGFYISPIIAGQRLRIDNLHKLIRNEASKLYEIALYSKRVEDSYHNSVMKQLSKYTNAAYSDRDTQGEKEFEKLMSILVDYSGDQKDYYKEMLKSAFNVQQNRSEINLQLTRRVYKNEWTVMLILFSITISFVLLIDLGDNWFLNLIPPILCAGLSMLIIILLKMSALTHKRALSIWDPLEKLATTKFHSFNT